MSIEPNIKDKTLKVSKKKNYLKEEEKKYEKNS